MAELHIILIACLVASAAALPGVFLVLRNVAMMSDAISHSVLLGIVIMFFIVKDIHSPILLVSAAATGVITVTLTELIIATNNVKKDAAIGLVFPVFFALAIILINLFASNVHLDQDAVLLGEIAFAPFNRFLVNEIDLGPIAYWIMGSIFILNLSMIILFYKQLKVSTFDSQLAYSLGYAPAIIHYGLMSSVSLTSVAAFDAVGAILIVAFIIVPPATAYILTESLVTMMVLSVALGCLSSILGVILSILVDGSIAGGICIVLGGVFTLSMFFSKKQGILMTYYQRKKQQVKFSSILLLVQLYDHEHTEKEAFENSFENLLYHMKWSKKLSKNVIEYSLNAKTITQKDNQFFLTDLGRNIAKKSIESS